MQRRKRLLDGTFSELENIGTKLTTDQQVAALGIQLAQEKMNSMQKDAIVNGLGAQVAQMKLEIMQLKGGAS